MLKFLKKIFMDEEETKVRQPATEIKLQNIEEWLNEKLKPLTEEVQQRTGEILMKVNEEIQRTRVNLEVLENAKLQNPNIPFKAKQYMEGNRKAYIRAINSFLGNMEINNKDYFYLIDFCRSFNGLINSLNKSTLRSYTILREFFANEAGKIAQNLKNFDDIFLELKNSLNNERLVKANNARKKIQDLKTKTKQKMNTDIDFKNAEASLKLANEDKNALIQEIEKFNSSEKHGNFLKLSDEKRHKEKAFYEDENYILQSFSVLERALRKYSHIAFEHEEIVLGYLKEPIETLANDKSLVILDVLNTIEKLLQENKLDIDDKKKSKSIEEIKKLNKEFLEHFTRKYFSFREEIMELENKIKATGVPEKFRNFNKQLEDSNLRIEKNSEEFEKLKNDVVKLENSIVSLKSELEDDVKDISGEDIRVVA